MECTTGNDLNLQDLVLQELVKIKDIGANDSVHSVPNYDIGLGSVRLSAAEVGDLVRLLL